MSTGILPSLSVVKPSFSRPSQVVNAFLPVATRTTSAFSSIYLPGLATSSTITETSFQLSFPPTTLVFIWNLNPYLVNSLWKVELTSLSKGGNILEAYSTTSTYVQSLL